MFSNGHKFNTFIAGVRKDDDGWRERATVVSRITLAEEVAYFYKKIWPREVAKNWGLTRSRRRKRRSKPRTIRQAASDGG